MQLNTSALEHFRGIIISYKLSHCNMKRFLSHIDIRRKYCYNVKNCMTVKLAKFLRTWCVCIFVIMWKKHFLTMNFSHYNVTPIHFSSSGMAAVSFHSKQGCFTELMKHSHGFHSTTMLQTYNDLTESQKLPDSIQRS